MHELVEVIEKAEDLKELKEKLLTAFKAELSTKGMECMDVKEAGEVVDMIKDLAEAEKACMEALYYQKVTEAMTSYEEPRYGESMGYNSNRYASGRYAPKGRGIARMGFMMPHTPYFEYDGNMQPDDYMHEAMMGYTSKQSMNGMSGNRNSNNMSRNESSNNNSSSNPNMGYWNNEEVDPRYGRAYNEYRMKRRHYTTSKSPDDRREMDTHAEEHLHDTITTVRDIWKDADPTLRKRMKDDFTKLLNEMTV